MRPKHCNYFNITLIFLFFTIFSLYIVKEAANLSLYAQQVSSPESKDQPSQALKVEDLSEFLTDLYKEGVLLYRKGEYRAAREKFDKIISIDPDYKGAKRYLIAIEKKLKATELKEAHIKEKEGLKKKQYEEKRQKEMARRLEKKKEEEIRVAYQEGEIHYKEANYSEAKLKFEKVLKLDPAHKGAKAYLRRAEAKIKEEEKAREKMVKQRAIEQARQREEEINSIYERGKENYKEADYGEAKLKFEEVLKLNPAHKGAKAYLQRAESKIKEEEEKAREEQKAREEKARQQAIKEAKEREEKIKLTEEAKIEESKPPAKIPSRPGIYTLEECINIAIENYLPLKIADEEIKLAKLKVREATREFFPALTLKWDEGEGKVTGREYESRKYGIEGRQPLYHGGELWFVLEQAKIGLHIAEENKKRIKSELISTVKKAFYSLARSKELLKQQGDLLGEVEQIFNSVNKQRQEGLCPELEFLDVQSKYNQVYFQFISVNEDLKLAELVLKQAMNIDPSQSIDIEYSLEFTKPPIDLEPCLELAFLNRSEIKIRKLIIDYAEYGKRIARAKGFPKVDISGSYGEGGEVYKENSLDMSEEWFLGTKVSVPFGGSTGAYSITKEKAPPVVSTVQSTESLLHSYRINIFDNLKYFSDKKETEIAYEQARHEFNNIKQKVRSETEEAFFSYEKALLQADAAKSKARFQAKEVEIFKLRRNFGEALDSQVAESLIKLAQEQFSYIQAVADCYIALADLNKAIGINNYFNP